MYANFHAVIAIQTGLTSNFYDQSSPVAHAYNFKYRFNKLKQLKAETGGFSPLRLSNSVVGQVTENKRSRCK